MNKKEFYKIQAESFKDYFNKFSDKDLLSVFEEWSESKDFVENDKKRIWKIVRRLVSHEKENK